MAALAARLRHPMGVHCLTRVRVVVTNTEGIPPHLRLLSDAGILSVQRGSRALVELTLDDGRRGGTKTFSPELPLVIHYEGCRDDPVCHDAKAPDSCNRRGFLARVAHALPRGGTEELIGL